MNINQPDTSLELAGNLVFQIDVARRITVAVAQYSHFSRQRKIRREEQSISARHLLMQTLAKFHPDLSQQALALIKTSSGQPKLTGTEPPFISISHSQAWVACAVAASSEASHVGIDIETIAPRNWDAYCDEVFHEEEKAWVSGASGHEKDIRGLMCWCRKEAILKALGIGIIMPLPEIGFSSDGTLIALPDKLGPHEGWKTYSTIIENRLVVAVAWKPKP